MPWDVENGARHVARLATGTEPIYAVDRASDVREQANRANTAQLPLQRDLDEEKVNALQCDPASDVAIATY